MRHSYLRHRGDAVLPTGSSINPKYPETNWLIQSWQKDLRRIVFYLVKFTGGPTTGYRLVSSFGSLGFKVGSTREYRHDQTMGWLGIGHIEAILKYPDLKKLSKPVPLWVYK